ncbi:hypothetical protein QJQ45_008151 [Haematococcus lacustris]|nr:hypothetical protein QJQ45_008151 [Haematococcus lacustris]
MLAAFVHYGQGGQAALRAAPDMTEEQWFRKCSTPETSWLRSYIRWAKGQRSKGIPAAGVKYLVWSCELRGIMLALRIAATTNRLFLVQQSKPAPMEVFLAPHLIDWSVEPSQLPAFEERKLYTSLPHYCEGDKPLGVHHHWNRTVSCAFFSLMVSCASGAHIQVLPDLHTVLGASSSSVGMHILPVPLLAKQAKGTVQRMEEQFVFLETSSPPWHHYAGVSHPIRSAHAQHCTFTALFQASEGTQQAAARHLALLGVQPGVTPYAVLHLRLGGSAGEGVNNYHHKGEVSVEEVLAAVQCVKNVITPKIRSTVEAELKLQNETSSSYQTLVLVTDNTELRQLVSHHRLLPQLAAVPSDPVHWDRFRDENLTAVFEVVVQ